MLRGLFGIVTKNTEYFLFKLHKSFRLRSFKESVEKYVQCEINNIFYAQNFTQNKPPLLTIQCPQAAQNSVGEKS